MSEKNAGWLGRHENLLAGFAFDHCCDPLDITKPKTTDAEKLRNECICLLVRSGVPESAIAARFGLVVRTVCAIVKRSPWSRRRFKVGTVVVWAGYPASVVEDHGTVLTLRVDGRDYPFVPAADVRLRSL